MECEEQRDYFKDRIVCSLLIATTGASVADLRDGKEERKNRDTEKLPCEFLATRYDFF